VIKSINTALVAGLCPSHFGITFLWSKAIGAGTVLA
jgi:hypothetical protein